MTRRDARCAAQISWRHDDVAWRGAQGDRKLGDANCCRKFDDDVPLNQRYEYKARLLLSILFTRGRFADQEDKAPEVRGENCTRSALVDAAASFLSPGSFCRTAIHLSVNALACDVHPAIGGTRESHSAAAFETRAT